MIDQYKESKEKPKGDKIKEPELHLSEDCELFVWDDVEKRRVEVKDALDLITDEVAEIMEGIRELNTSCSSTATNGWLDTVGHGGGAGEKSSHFPH